MFTSRNMEWIWISKKNATILLVRPRNINIFQHITLGSYFEADQTPTPTRLIRNCGEVGFDLIEDFNVFEETFRREVSAKKHSSSSSLETPEIHNEETLHTPNVLGYFRLSSASNEASNGNTSKQSSEPHKHREGTTTEEANSEPDSVREEKSDGGEETLHVSLTEDALLDNPANSTHSTLVQSVVVMPAYIVPVTKIKSDPVKLSWVSKNSGNNLKRLQPKTVPKPVVITSNSVKDKLKEILLKTNRDSVSVFHPAANDESALKRRESHPVERRSVKPLKLKTSDGNRAAARRYRMKMKKQFDSMIKENAELLAENQRLRSELESMKRILSARQDCSVSKKLVVLGSQPDENTHQPVYYVIQPPSDKSNTCWRSSTSSVPSIYYVPNGGIWRLLPKRQSNACCGRRKTCAPRLSEANLI